MMCEKLKKKLLNGSISLLSERWSTSTQDSGQRPKRKVRNLQNVRLMQFIRGKHMKTSLDSDTRRLIGFFCPPPFSCWREFARASGRRWRVTWLSEKNWTRVEAWHSSNFKFQKKKLPCPLCIHMYVKEAMKYIMYIYYNHMSIV